MLPPARTLSVPAHCCAELENQGRQQFPRLPPAHALLCSGPVSSRPFLSLPLFSVASLTVRCLSLSPLTVAFPSLLLFTVRCFSVAFLSLPLFWLSGCSSLLPLVVRCLSRLPLPFVPLFVPSASVSLPLPMRCTKVVRNLLSGRLGDKSIARLDRIRRQIRCHPGGHSLRDDEPAMRCKGPSSRAPLSGPDQSASRIQFSTSPSPHPLHQVVTPSPFAR